MQPIEQHRTTTANLRSIGEGPARTRRALRRLVRAEIDLIACVAVAHAHGALGEELGRMRADLERHVLEMSEILRLLGERPPRLRADLRGRVLSRLAAWAARRGDGSLVQSLARQVERLDLRYERALAWDLPLEVGASLIVNQLDLRRQRAWLRSMALHHA